MAHKNPIPVLLSVLREIMAERNCSLEQAADILVEELKKRNLWRA